MAVIPRRLKKKTAGENLNIGIAGRTNHIAGHAHPYVSMAPKPITLEGNRGNRRDGNGHITWIDRLESAADIVELLIAIALVVLCASALSGWFLLGWRRGLSGLGCGRLGGRQGEFDAIVGLLGHQAIFDPVENLLVPGIL